MVLLVGVIALAGCSDEPAAEPAPTPAPSPVETVSPPVEEVLTTRIAFSEFAEFDFVTRDWGGRWELEFLDDGFYQLRSPSFRFAEAAVFTEDGFLVTSVAAPEGVFNCAHEDGRPIVGDERADAVYSYEFDDSTLTFTAEEDPCPLRPVLLERAWKP